MKRAARWRPSSTLFAGGSAPLSIDPFLDFAGPEAQTSGRSLRETAAEGLKDTSPAVAARLDALFDPDEAVKAKALPGGTAPAAVRASLDDALAALES